MKNSIMIFTILICLSYASFAQKAVGTIVNGKPVITMNLDELKLKLSSYIESTGIPNVSLTDVSIKISDDGTYFIVAKDLNVRDNLTYTYGFSLTTKGESLLGAGGTVTCKGCSDGCDPESSGFNKWRCTQCSWQGNCEKSVTMPTNYID